MKTLATITLASIGLVTALAPCPIAGEQPKLGRTEVAGVFDFGISKTYSSECGQAIVAEQVRHCAGGADNAGTVEQSHAT